MHIREVENYAKYYWLLKLITNNDMKINGSSYYWQTIGGILCTQLKGQCCNKRNYFANKYKVINTYRKEQQYMEVASGWNEIHTSCLSHYSRRVKLYCFIK